MFIEPGGNGSDRRAEFVLTKKSSMASVSSFLKRERAVTLYIEMACNGIS